MLNWEKVDTADPRMYRAKVPGGWLVMIVWGNEASITFYPDPDHEWDGSSLP